MTEVKPVMFRSKYERFQTYVGDKPANLETNTPAKAGKLIRFSRFKYTTSDEKEIAVLRKLAAKNSNITEVKPEKKIKVIEIDDEQTVEEALEKSLAAEKEMTQDNRTKESTPKVKTDKK